jgi:hypothetical protein
MVAHAPGGPPNSNPSSCGWSFAAAGLGDRALDDARRERGAMIEQLRRQALLLT